MTKPLLVTDGRYLFAHTDQGIVGPLNFNPHPTEDGQIDFEVNYRDEYGCPFNPKECAGGKVHKVDNTLFPPPELQALR
ncbi:hypothetical protein LCGC14_3079590 [marine sediment metagenome]|uniref:Uncharacterized protein n=1 Tax=marine sediment metagenome TaxID=412755 RepID=A0A0F8WEI7_9ZZZZ